MTIAHTTDEIIMTVGVDEGRAANAYFVASEVVNAMLADVPVLQRSD